MTKARNGLLGLIITGFFLATGSLLFWPASAGAQTTGLMVGSPSNPLPINAGTQNLFYGVVTATSTLGNFVLLEKGPGTPIFRIGVDGSIYTTGDLVGGNTVWSISGNNIFNANTGNVGVGTSAPTKKLEISADPAVDGSNYPALRIRSTLNSSAWVPDAVMTGLEFFSDDATQLGQRFYIHTKASAASGTTYNSIGTGALEQIRMISGGGISVPVGTRDTLVVGATSSSLPTRYANSTFRSVQVNGGSTTRGGVLAVKNSDATLEGTFAAFDGLIEIGSMTNHSVAVFANATEVARFRNNGSVGIGTTNPTQLLEVAGAAKFNNVSFGVTPTSGQTTALATVEYANSVGLPAGTSGQTLRHTGSAWQPNSVLYNNGTNVGISNTSPAAKLDITGGLNLTDRHFTTLGNVRTFENVAQYYPGSTPNTGTVVVTIGNTPNIMLDAEIVVQAYNGLTKCHVRGYTYVGTAGWHLPAATCLGSGGSGGNYTVRFAKRTSDAARVIMIGNTTTAWGSHPHVAVTRVTYGYPGSGTSPGDWSIAIVTDESAYDNIVDVAENNWFYAYNPTFDGNVYFPTSGMWHNTGNVGIKTTNPTQVLEVAGAAKFNNVSFGVTPTSGQTTALATVEYVNGAISGGPWTRTAPFTYLTNSTDNVGIGKTGPNYKLDISGGVRIEGANALDFGGTGPGDWQGRIRQGGQGLQLNLNNFEISNAGYASPASVWFKINSAGNVGIGTTNPQYTLDVAGSARLVNTSTSNLEFAFGAIQNSYPYRRIDSWTSDHSGYFWAFGYRRFDNTNQKIHFFVKDQERGIFSADKLDVITFTANEMGGGLYPTWTTAARLAATGHSYINGTGNMGIGTTNPTMKLEVAGAAKFNNVSFGVTPTSGQTTALATVEYVNGILPPGSLGQTLRHNGSGWVADSNLYNNGTNVGMGLATTPATRLDIRDANNDTAIWSRNGTIILRNTNATANTWQGIQSQGTGSINAGIAFVNMDQANSYGRIDFGVRGASGWFGAAMSVNNGNVGVGTTNPAGPLNVVKAAGDNFIYADTYSSTGGNSNYWFSRRSHGNTTGTLTTTLNGDYQGVFYFQGVNTSNTFNYGAEIVAQQNGAAGTYVPTDLKFSTYSSTAKNANQLVLLNTGVSYFNAGNVGIGTTNPTMKLEVAGAAKFNNVSFGVTPTSGQTTALATVEYVTGAVSGAAGPWTRSGSSTYLANNNDNTGVGTTNPGAKLHVSAASTAPGNRGQFVVGTGTGTGSGNLDLGFNSTSGYAWLQSGVDGISFNNLILNLSGGNVGIGTVSPANAKLEVNGSINVQSLGDSYRFNGRTDLGLFGNGNYSLALQSPNDITVNIDSNNNDTTAAFRINTNTTGITGGTNLLTLMENGNLGLGLTNPSQRLEVAGAAKFNNISYGVTPPSALITALATVEYVNNYVGGATTSSIYLPKTGGTMIGDINMGGNHLTNVGELYVSKLYATVIDPLYHLKGTNYSTFAASIVGGLKEEYVGQARIEKKNARLGEYEHIIDFAAASEGSDLWVWRQVVDFSSQNVEVLATPSGHFAQLYYIIEGEKVILRSDRPADISYRLIGKRLDWRQWPTKAIDQSVRGVTLTP